MKKVRRSELQVVAYILMFINHFCYVYFGRHGTGYSFWIDLHWYITRGSFVIFAFLISEGMRYSSNRTRYLLRLFAGALISEVPFDLFSSGTVWDPSGQNVYFTLFLAALAITLSEKCRSRILQGLVCLSCMLAALWLRSDYSFLGVLLVLTMYLFRGDDFWFVIASASVLFFGTMALTATEFLHYYGHIYRRYLYNSAYVELYGIAVFPMILNYDGEKGRVYSKWLTYLFYPAHLLLVWWLCTYVL